MTTPTDVVRSVNFQQEESNAVSGRSTVRTSALDVDLNALVAAVNHIISNLSLVQRDDLVLLDEVVWLGSLAPDVLALIGSAGFTVHDPLTWVTATDYPARDMVVNGTGTYVSSVAHTSGVFATDLAAGKWALLFDTAGRAFTPTDTISSTTVQAAIEEVDAEGRAQNHYLNQFGGV